MALRRVLIKQTPAAKHSGEALRQGANVTQATYDAGYGSSSRVVDPSGANLGMSPGNFDKGTKPAYPLGHW